MPVIILLALSCMANGAQPDARETTPPPRCESLDPALTSPREFRAHADRINVFDGKIDLSPAGFGDTFGFLHWPRWGEADVWQLSLSGTALVEFDRDSSSMNLFNADYLISFPLGFRAGPWSSGMRLSHERVHFSDDFLFVVARRPSLNAPRIHLAFEIVELVAAWEWVGVKVPF